MKIKILVTGGTIDGIDSDTGKQSAISVIPFLMKQGRVTEKFTIETLMMKDSREITQPDREQILDACNKSEEEKLIITHGTMAMVETANFLKGRIHGKTIVLVGAMIPAGEDQSDALFNLGFAFSSAQLLTSGVYITMNGKVFNPEKVTKNLEKGLFEEKDNG